VLPPSSRDVATICINQIQPADPALRTGGGVESRLALARTARAYSVIFHTADNC
jgi:hypothetical protein